MPLQSICRALVFLIALTACGAPPTPAPPAKTWEALDSGTLRAPQAGHRYTLWLTQEIPDPEAFEELLAAATLPATSSGGGANRRVSFEGSRCRIKSLSSDSSTTSAQLSQCAEALRAQAGSNLHEVICDGEVQLDVFVSAQNLSSALVQKLGGVAYHHGRGHCERAGKLQRFKVEETISIQKVPLEDGAVGLRTRGLNAFAQPELVLSPVPEARHEAAKGLLFSFAAQALVGGEKLSPGGRLSATAATALLTTRRTYDTHRPHSPWAAEIELGEANLFLVPPAAPAGDQGEQRRFVLQLTLP
ncbi:MAG: hypothetical protein VYD19_05435 [Myxococcota bacterium]|nr:hypothetical protein [Myxococcota bacterium]